MNVVVLVAGIEDPKWPFASGKPRIASPFDESALESALKLRDADPATSITAVVAAAAGEESLLRSVAAHHLDGVLHALAPESMAWDAWCLAHWWNGVLGALPARPDLVLTGREFGDRDDGTLPACLAEVLGGAFSPRVVEASGVPKPGLGSVTNDVGNKLRHPLMKNVMAARAMKFASAHAPANVVPGVVVSALEPAPAPTRTGAVRMLADVDALADCLRPWRAQP